MSYETIHHSFGSPWSSSDVCSTFVKVSHYVSQTTVKVKIHQADQLAHLDLLEHDSSPRTVPERPQSVRGDRLKRDLRWFLETSTTSGPRQTFFCFWCVRLGSVFISRLLNRLCRLSSTRSPFSISSERCSAKLIGSWPVYPLLTSRFWYNCVRLTVKKSCSHAMLHYIEVVPLV